MKIKIIFVILLSVFLFYKLAKIFSSGSYPYSEVFEIEMNDSLLVEQIKQFKHKNIGFNVPTESNLEDDIYDKNSNHLIFYFYYKQENQIILTWVRGLDKENCQFAIVSINEGTELGKWKELNNDLGFFETRKEREKFEEQILKPLNVPFKRKSIL